MRLGLRVPDDVDRVNLRGREGALERPALGLALVQLLRKSSRPSQEPRGAPSPGTRFTPTRGSDETPASSWRRPWRSSLRTSPREPRTFLRPTVPDFHVHHYGALRITHGLALGRGIAPSGFGSCPSGEGSHSLYYR